MHLAVITARYKGDEADMVKHTFHLASFDIMRTLNEEIFTGEELESGFTKEYRLKSLEQLNERLSFEFHIGGDYFRCTAKEENDILRTKTEKELFAERARRFIRMKDKYGLSNRDLYGLTGVHSKRWDEFESTEHDLNKNVFFSFCFFFELSWKEATDFIYYSKQTFSNESVTDKLFRLYIDNKTYALASFIDDVNMIYEMRRNEGINDKLPSFYDLETGNKMYFDTSLSDCLNGNEFNFILVIQENKKHSDRRRKEFKNIW